MVKNRVRSAKFLVNLYVLANFKTACISIVELNHGISFILRDELFYKHKIVNNFLLINFNMCLGAQKNRLI